MGAAKIRAEGPPLQIKSLRVSGFKGVDVDVPWATAVVLFGPNDGGKTNVLEALLSAFVTGARAREDPYEVGNDLPELELIVELEGLDREGHTDQELLAEWLTPMIDQTGPELLQLLLARAKRARGQE